MVKTDTYKRKTDRIFDNEAFKKACNDHRNGLSVREATLKYNRFKEKKSLACFTD